MVRASRLLYYEMTCQQWCELGYRRMISLPRVGISGFVIFILQAAVGGYSIWEHPNGSSRQVEAETYKSPGTKRKGPDQRLRTAASHRDSPQLRQTYDPVA